DAHRELDGGKGFVEETREGSPTGQRLLIEDFFFGLAEHVWLAQPHLFEVMARARQRGVIEQPAGCLVCQPAPLAAEEDQVLVDLRTLFLAAANEGAVARLIRLGRVQE